MIPFNRSSSTNPLKKKYEEEENSPTNGNLFARGNGTSPSNKGASLDFDNEKVSNEQQQINSIFEANTYNHSYETLVEFYSDIYYIMNAREVSDKRNVGTVTGIAACCGVGCLTFGVGCIAGIAGVVLGSTIGRCFGNKFGKKKKNAKTTQEDLYLAKLKCMLQLGKNQKKKLKNDNNKLRLTIEKIIEEFAPALEISIFQKPKEVHTLLLGLQKLLLEKPFQEALLLSYKLFKVAEERYNMKEKIYLQDASKRFNQVFVPFIRIIEFENKGDSPAKSTPGLIAYQRIKSLVSNSSTVEKYSQLPGSRPTTDALDKLKDFLREEVDFKASIVRAMSKETNNQMTENAELKSPPKSSKSPTFVSSPSKLDQEDNVIKLTTLSSKDMQGEDVEEIPNPHSVNLYAFESPTKKRFNENEDEPENQETNEMKTQVRIIIPRRSESSIIESHSGGHVPGNGEWTVSMKLHQDIASFSEAAQIEVEAQREALRLSAQHFQRSPTKKGTRFFRGEEDEEEKDSEGKEDGLWTPGGENSKRSPKKEKSMLLKALTPKKIKSSLSSVLKKPKTGKHDSEESPEKNEIELANDNLLNQNQAFGKAEEMFNRILEIGADYTSKWERVSSNPVITIDKIRPEGSPVVLIRAWALIQGFTPQEVFDQIYDTEKRAKWETVTMDLKVVEKINDNSQVIYFYVKTPIGISERDFVQIRDFRLNYPEKDNIVMSFKSCLHPKAPPVKGRVRAETHISGYIMRPSTKAPNSTDFCIVSQSDIKGNIPKIVVNMASGKAPAEWINKLVKACERSRKETK